MAYRKLLLDVDGTLLDFNASADAALKELFAERGYDYSEHVFERYEIINKGLWERYERGEIPRQQVLTQRFDMLFAELGIDEAGAAFEHDFRDGLERNPVWIEGAEAFLQYLRPKYDLYIVTNGVERTQRRRLAITGLDSYVREVFISEVLGAQKPQKEFFDACFEKIGSDDLSEYLLIGDSLSADILGANNAGIHSCWVNFDGQPAGGPGVPDYEVHSFEELKKFL